MTAQILPWRAPKVRVEEWPILEGPFGSFVITIHGGREHTFRSTPTVTVTEYSFDPIALIKAIIEWRGIKHAFSSRELAKLDWPVFGDMKFNGRKIGNALSDLAENGYPVEVIDENRDGKIWWVTASLGK